MPEHVGMIKPVFLRSNHLYVFGLVLLVIGLPLSLFLTSLSQFVLAGSLFLEGNVVEKFKRYFKNKPALILTGILLLHVVGLLWTADFSEGIKDIRIKLPLLSLPLIMAGSEPLSKKQFHLVLGFFIASVFAGTMVSMAVLTGIIHREITDIREIFIFHISHIRFALFICVSVFALLYFIFSSSYSLSLMLKAVYALLVLWLITFLFIMESVTGLSTLAVTGTLVLFYRAFKSKSVFLKTSLLLLALFVPVSILFVVWKYENKFSANHPVEINLQDTTLQGHHYTCDTLHQQYENGYPVWVYICEDELRSSWNKLSSIRYDSLDLRKQRLSYTLIRFLASKGLRRDANGVSNLSAKEIHSIENGIANVNYQDISSIESRLMQILWEWDHFRKGGDPSGHSVMQRIEFWRAAKGIIREHPFIGVGTGDMPAAYKSQYEKMKTALTPIWRLRAHNQFLAIAVAFGLIGLIFFLFALFFPLFYNQKKFDYFYVTFFVIACLSMLTEDTLETQTGATFFAFFSCLFLFGREKISEKG